MTPSKNKFTRFPALMVLCMGLFAFGCATKADIQALSERMDGMEATAQRALDNSQGAVNDAGRQSAMAAVSARQSEESAERAETAAVRAENAAERAESAAERCETLYRRIMSK